MGVKFLNPNSILIRDTTCVEEILEGEIVLYSAKNSQAIYLNNTASLIWQLIDNKHTVDDIMKLLSDTYPEEATIQSDICQTLDILVQYGVVLYG